jgi:hypothetical protein
MNIVNIGFTEISAKRQATPRGNIAITNNVKILSVEEAKMGLDNLRQSFKVIFNYKTEYTPNFATIEMSGEVLILGTADEAKNLLAQWAKEKKISPEPARIILNNIMSKCALEVIILSKELNLPSPIPLPSIKAEGVQESTNAPAQTATKTAPKVAPKAEKAPKKK